MLVWCKCVRDCISILEGWAAGCLVMVRKGNGGRESIKE